MRKLFIASLAVTFALISLNGLAAKNSPKEPEKVNKLKLESILKVTSQDMTLGNPNAKVTIIEYSSLNCPHCAKFHRDAFKEIKSDYIDKGDVLYVYRDFPLNRVALAASILTHCSGKDKYFEFLSSLFDSQDLWAFHANYMDSLLNIAKLGGISEEKFKECQNNKQLEDFITKRMMEVANAYEIHATPTFFINSEKITGIISYNEFKPLIEKALTSFTSK